MRRAIPGIAMLLLLGAVAPSYAAGPARTVVFFPSWSALIDKPAHDAIAGVAAAARAQPAARIELVGYASTIGSVPANTLLAKLRAQVVLDELRTDGVAPDRISVRAVGPTSFALDPVESRRVEIILGSK